VEVTVEAVKTVEVRLTIWRNILSLQSDRRYKSDKH